MQPTQQANVIVRFLVSKLYIATVKTLNSKDRNESLDKKIKYVQCVHKM